MHEGIVYLSEDRKGKGLLLTSDLSTNLTLAALAHFARGMVLDRAKENAALDTAIAEFDVRAPRKDMLAGQLSGGNQQKLLLAKMMLLEPEIVVIDEPTRGIDIGTKQQIYEFITAARRQGQGGHRDLVGDAGADRHLPSHPGDARRAHRRRGVRASA